VYGEENIIKIFNTYSLREFYIDISVNVRLSKEGRYKHTRYMKITAYTGSQEATQKGEKGNLINYE